MDNRSVSSVGILLTGCNKKYELFKTEKSYMLNKISKNVAKGNNSYAGIFSIVCRHPWNWYI